jgi:hypothetical protein
MARRTPWSGVVTLGLAVALGATLFGQGRTSSPGPVPRTADGRPDFQGRWTNATYTPFERPEEFANKEFFSVAEAEAYAKSRHDRLLAQPQDAIHYDDAIWQSEPSGAKGVSTLRTSLVVEPKNGKIPPMNAEGRRRAEERAEARKKTDQFASAQARPLAERCIMWGHEGPPMLPAGYFPNLEIVQSPGQVAVLQEITHNARVIPVDAGPHVASSIRQYGGNSRGRWEGDTLVVENRNFTDLTQFRGASEQMVVTERFTMLDADNIKYEFTVTDPATWDTPWKAEVPLKRTPDPVFEYACHEGNYGMQNILRAKRLEEAKARGGTQ